jgi:LysM repeat protein
MKMKKAVRMPLRRSPQRPRPATAPLRARAATVDETYDEEEDYASEEEPNMKFTHALFVVLVLHIIAVGGVFAFNWMKTRQGSETAPVAKAPAAEKVAAPVAAKLEAPAKPVAAKPANLDGWTGKTHTVEPGDTLTHIASTHKVSVGLIEKENDITSYSLLRVGQVLKIPGTAKTAKTESPKAHTAKEAFLATKVESAPAKPAGTITAVSRNSSETTTAKSTESKAPAMGGDSYVVSM